MIALQVGKRVYCPIAIILDYDKPPQYSCEWYAIPGRRMVHKRKIEAAARHCCEQVRYVEISPKRPPRKTRRRRKHA